MNAEHPLTPGLRVGLSTLAEAAGASRAALFAPRQSSLVLVVQIELNQQAWDIPHLLWARRREKLEAGSIERYGFTLVWPLFDAGKLVGLVYLDHARDGFPDERSREDAALLATRVASLTVSASLNSYLTTGLLDPGAVHELQRDQIVVSLEATGGNLSAAARHLGLSRQAFHARAVRYGVDPEVFKKRRRRK